MRVIEQTDRFTLLGADARRGKLTLFDAEGPREQGALARIGLRVSALEGRDPLVDLGEGLRDRPRRGGDRLRARPRSRLAPRQRSRRRPRAGGSSSASRRRVTGALEVGGAYLELTQGDPGEPERPLLNHIGVLVDSVDEHQAEAEELGVEIDDSSTRRTRSRSSSGARTGSSSSTSSTSRRSRSPERAARSPAPAWPASSQRLARASSVLRRSSSRRETAPAGRCCSRAA